MATASEKILNEYKTYMSEIKKRAEVCARVINQTKSNGSVTGYIETDIDLIYSQIRKIIELILFSSTTAHKLTTAKLKKDAEKAYNAGKLMSYIKERNPDYYPIPVYDGVPKDGNKSLERVSNFNGNSFIEEVEMKVLYNKVCGSFSHANRKYHYGNTAAKKVKIDEADKYLHKIIKLLNYHTITLDKNIILIVIMSVDGGDNIQVAMAKSFGPN